MIRLTELKLALPPLPHTNAPAALEPACQSHPESALRVLAAQTLGLALADIASLQVFKRSFDARKPDLLAVYIVDLTLRDPAQEAALLQRHAGHAHIQPSPPLNYCPPVHASAPQPQRPVIVGFGPCGIFSALLLAQMGFRPIVLERGKSVRERTQDTWGLWRKKVLQAESNAQFGEGGAGTFSDGKLYSQIKDPRHLGRKLMTELVAAGAPADILFEARPHIGTFKLVKVLEKLRARIVALGGEIRFQQRVCDVLLEDTAHGRALCGLRVLDQSTGQHYELATRHAVLALGHSARDTFAMLWERGVAMQAKPFSVGVRIEHPQSVIDRARWGRHAGHPLLGAADYRLTHHAKNGRTVYSFCMCPGGSVVAASSEPGGVVTNGMSQYSRQERNANAGLVVGIGPPDYPEGERDRSAWLAAFGPEDGARYAAQASAMALQQPRGYHPLAGIVLQRQLESRAFVLGGSNYEAPGQLLGDFLAEQPSSQWGAVRPSYQPGVKLGDLSQALPAYAVQALREAVPIFGRKIKGYDMPDAVLTGVETRTSSPLCLLRGADLQSLNVRGLYPAGEGAGYAGGILSAGVDGIKVAEALAVELLV